MTYRVYFTITKNCYVDIPKVPSRERLEEALAFNDVNHFDFMSGHVETGWERTEILGMEEIMINTEKYEEWYDGMLNELKDELEKYLSEEEMDSFDDMIYDYRFYELLTLIHYIEVQKGIREDLGYDKDNLSDAIRDWIKRTA